MLGHVLNREPLGLMQHGFYKSDALPVISALKEFLIIIKGDVWTVSQ